MKQLYKILLLFMLLPNLATFAAVTPVHKAEPQELDVRNFILEHVSDAYVWHITKVGEHEVYIPLPVILYSQTSGWHLFLSSVFHHNPEYMGFVIAEDGKYKGKIVENLPDGSQVRPFDVSITKNAFSLLFGSALLIFIIMTVARAYKRDPLKPKGGFVGFMEMFITNINDDVIKPCVGKDYKKYSPYLLTVFFFIFFNNLLGIIPLFPGGANVTGNIAITFTLAIFTFFIVNFSGTKEYWREIFWPDVPVWLKVPVPLMPAIELVGVFTKPFALMVRLFANILAGHSIVLGLTCLVFVTVKMGPAMNTSMTVLSLIFTIFINMVEILVAYIQAYVFVLLSAVFIGLARVEPHKKH